MRGNSGLGFGQGRNVGLFIAFLAVMGLIGIGLLWVGFSLGRESRQPEAAQTTAMATSLAALPTSLAVVPTSTLLPTATLPPAPTATVTPIPEPMIVAQEGGVNVRSGPGTNFSEVGRLEGGQSARVTGRYGDWWQIDYNGVLAWVAGWVVAASNTEGVPEVVPPPSPTPRPTIVPTATPIPATATPAVTPTPETRGLKVNEFEVGHKVSGEEDVNPSSGPFGNAGDIWFCFDVVNQTGGSIDLDRVGAWAQENNHFQVSWGVAGPFSIGPGGQVGGSKWCDHFYNDKDPKFGVGTYHIWLRICFTDGGCVNAAGPAEVKIG